MSRAIVAYSFGGDKNRPGNANEVLASVVNEAKSSFPDSRILVQDFIEPVLEKYGLFPDLVVVMH